MWAEAGEQGVEVKEGELWGKIAYWGWNSFGEILRSKEKRSRIMKRGEEMCRFCFSVLLMYRLGQRREEDSETR